MLYCEDAIWIFFSIENFAILVILPPFSVSPGAIIPRHHATPPLTMIIILKLAIVYVGDGGVVDWMFLFYFNLSIVFSVTF